MPIEGFVRERLPRLGKIRLGGRAVASSGKEYPKDLTHFVVPDEVAEKLGTPEPTEFDVCLPSLEIDEFFPVWLKRYGTGGRLLCKGDGRTANCVDETTGEMTEIECQYKDCPYYAEKKCTEVGNLMVILPDVNIGGVYQIDTGSFHGINNVYNAARLFISMARALMPNPEQARFVRLKLVREATSLQYIDPKTNKPKTVDKAILNLRIPMLTMSEAQQLAGSARGLQLGAGGQGSVRALPAGAGYDDADDETVQGYAVPEPDEAQPTDLYPNAAPPAATMDQKERFGDLLEQYGGSPTKTAQSVCKGVSGGQAASIDQLTRDEADAAIAELQRLLAEKTAAPAPAPAQTRPPEDDCADENQRTEFDKLKARLSVLGKSPSLAEKGVCERVTDGRYSELIALSREQAAAAIAMLKPMVQRFEAEATTTAAPAPAPQPEPAPATSTVPARTVDPETGEITDGATADPQPALVGDEELSF